MLCIGRELLVMSAVARLWTRGAWEICRRLDNRPISNINQANDGWDVIEEKLEKMSYRIQMGSHKRLVNRIGQKEWWQRTGHILPGDCIANAIKISIFVVCLLRPNQIKHVWNSRWLSTDAVFVFIISIGFSSEFSPKIWIGIGAAFAIERAMDAIKINETMA